MKFRSDFVTNSSSSSYICEVCGDVQSGWDMSLSEAEMFECEKGHTFCQSEAVGELDKAAYARRIFMEEKASINMSHYKDSGETDTEFETRLMEDDDVAEEFADNYCELDYHYPKENCPICTHEHITYKEVVSFACNKLGISYDELHKLAKEYLIEKDKQEE